MEQRLVNKKQYYGCLLAMLFTACISKTTLASDAAENTRFRVQDASAVSVENVYRLNAEVEFYLSVEAREALENGVPLVLEIKIEVLKIRPWLWSTVIAKLAQRYRLDYHALSQRYRVRNINTGVQRSYRTLDIVLQVIGTLKDFPMLDQHILDSTQHYIARVRADLDIEALPTPIRFWAYSSSKWRLTSEWFQWRLQ